MARFFVYFNNIYFSNVKIDEQVIKSSPDLKLLGVTLDDELSFSTHISDICKMASKKVGVLVRLRNIYDSQRSQVTIVQISNIT